MVVKLILSQNLKITATLGAWNKGIRAALCDVSMQKLSFTSIAATYGFVGTIYWEFVNQLSRVL